MLNIVCYFLMGLLGILIIINIIYLFPMYLDGYKLNNNKCLKDLQCKLKVDDDRYCKQFKIDVDKVNLFTDQEISDFSADINLKLLNDKKLYKNGIIEILNLYNKKNLNESSLYGENKNRT